VTYVNSCYNTVRPAWTRSEAAPGAGQAPAGHAGDPWRHRPGSPENQAASSRELAIWGFNNSAEFWSFCDWAVEDAGTVEGGRWGSGIPTANPADHHRHPPPCIPIHVVGESGPDHVNRTLRIARYVLRCTHHGTPWAVPRKPCPAEISVWPYGNPTGGLTERAIPEHRNLPRHLGSFPKPAGPRGIRKKQGSDLLPRVRPFCSKSIPQAASRMDFRQNGPGPDAKD